MRIAAPEPVLLFGCPKSWQLHTQNYFDTFYFGELKPYNSNTTYLYHNMHVVIC